MKSFRISLSTALLLTAVVALCIALVQARAHIARLESEIGSLIPLRTLDIIAQVEAATESAGAPAMVELLAFSGNGPTYRVAFTYLDANTGTPKSSSFILTHKGDGRYSGHLRTGPYLRNEPDEKGEWGTEVVVWDKDVVNAFPPERRAGQGMGG